MDKEFFQPLIDKACELLNLNKVILFGSWARGDQSEKSDIDLAFDFDEGQWIEFKLWVDEHFTTLREIDLVDLHKVDQDILASIEAEGVILYAKQNH